MATSLLHLFASAALFTAGVLAEVEVGALELPVDDACDAGDASCSLSLRQLRGELSVKGAPEESGAFDEASLAEVAEAAGAEAVDAAGDVAADIAAEVSSQIASAIAAEVKAGTAAGAVKATSTRNATIEAVSKAMGGSACVNQAGWDVDFAKHSFSCALKSMGHAHRSGRCMANRQGVSHECGACIGQLIHCGRDPGCARECCYGSCTQHTKWRESGNHYCREDFMNCAGVDTPAP